MSLQLECVDSKCMQTTAMLLPSSKKITSLPQEVLDQILSNLSKHDLQAAVCVSRDISQRVKAVANFNGPHSINNFILMLIQKLNAEIFLTQRKRLEEIAEDIIPHEFSNLLMLKSYLLAVELELVRIIKSLYVNNVYIIIDDVKPPHFIEDVFELVRFGRQIDAANVIPNELIRRNTLRDIFKALVQAGKINRAIDVAKSIDNEYRRSDTLRDIAKVLTQAGKINRAIDVAKSIDNEYRRSDTLRDIAKVLTQAGKINRAIEVAQSIDNEYARIDAINSICQALIELGKIIKAEEVGKLIGRRVTCQQVTKRVRQPNDWSIKKLPNKTTQPVSFRS
ncbi:MAG: hypothetical protein RLZZ453_550 [Chlamydiota bacterium]